MEIDLSLVQIRPAVAADAEAIAHVHIDSWRQAYTGIVPEPYLAALSVPERTASWSARIQAANGQVWISEAEGSLLGFAHIGPSRDDDATRATQELYAIYLEPIAWGSGVARDLLRTALAAYDDQTPVTLWVLADNERAQHFYRRHGFVVDSQERIGDFGGAALREVRYRRNQATRLG